MLTDNMSCMKRIPPKVPAPSGLPPLSLAIPSPRDAALSGCSGIGNCLDIVSGHCACPSLRVSLPRKALRQKRQAPKDLLAASKLQDIGTSDRPCLPQVFHAQAIAHCGEWGQVVKAPPQPLHWDSSFPTWSTWIPNSQVLSLVPSWGHMPPPHTDAIWGSLWD